MSAWQDGTVKANGLHLYYTRTGGGGPPMVLAHGLTDNGLAWSRLAHKLEATCDMVMVDARGHGLSDKPESGYTPADHESDLAGVIEALGLQQPILMGHSMGAVTASMVAADHPEMTRAVILEDPVWSWPTSTEQYQANRQKIYENWRKRLELRKRLTTAESLARGPRERPLWAPEDHDADVPAKEQVAMQALDYVLQMDQGWAQQVAKFESPVLLIYGNPELGGVVGPDVAAEAHRINPLVTPVQIPTAGHSIRRERFDDYVAALREFFAQIQRRPF